MTKEYTCQDCKHYYYDEQYCTSVFKGKKFPPNTPICDTTFFEKGIFTDRFWILAKPLKISTGYYYVLIDRQDELKDDEGDYLSFKYEDEIETLAEFLNKQENMIKKNMRKEDKKV